jgi:hypothetical protein
MKNDIDIIAKTLYAEARGEGLKGLRAVATVIYNRSKGDENKFAKECLKDKQFSCWNNNEDIIINDKKSYEICKKIAEEMMLKSFIPYEFKTLKNPKHYCTTKLYKKNPPKWAINQPSEQLGNHTFFELT